MKILGALLLAVGVLILVYGGFSYSREKADAKVGPVEIEVSEQERVNLPVWGGVAAIVVGGVLLAVRRR